MKRRIPSGMTVVVDIPDFNEVHLAKDVGEIPRTYSRLFNESSHLFYPRTQTISSQAYDPSIELVGIKPAPSIIRKIPSTFLVNAIQATKLLLGAIIRIRKSRVLLIFHLQPYWGFAISVVKPLIPKDLQIHLKMDLSSHWLIELRSQSYNSPWYVRFFHKRLLLLANIISVETRDMFTQLRQSPLYGIDISSKLVLMPNGVAELPADSNRACAREKMIITIGRLGSYQKNTELLLNALLQVNLKEWKVFLIGEIDVRFESWLNQFLTEHPKLASQITFTGHISDRSVLISYLKRASLFCLPSRWESSGLVLLEALQQGCPILSTKVGTAPDLIQDDDVGRLFDNEDISSLAQQIQECIDGNWDINGMGTRAQNLVSNHYRWSSILQSMHEKWFNRSHS